MKMIGKAVAMSISLAFVASCGLDVEDVHVDVRPPSHGVCRIPSASVQLQGAICSADVDQIGRAVDELSIGADVKLSTPEEYEQKAVQFMRSQYNVLFKVFLGDRGVGSGLPWDQLMSAQLRVAIARLVAEGARAGRADYSLDEVRRFALSQLAKEQPRPAPQTLQLLGSVEAPKLVPILKPYLSKPESIRYSAAYALALSCTQRARDLLTSLRADVDWTDSYSEGQLTEAIEYNKVILKLWCDSAD